MMNTPLSFSDFEKLLAGGFAGMIKGAPAVALGLSGGPDSLALCKFLSLWSEKHGGPVIHAITVDHGLRAESAQEAEQIAEWIAGWPKVEHVILRWQGEKPKSKIQEEARHARYERIADYCCRKKIMHVFLAHHQDDQAETFLFRLAKGSGLDGLAAMMPVQDFRSGLVLLRPLLDVPKEELVAACAAMDVPFVRDPSNEDDRYARVRLRKAKEVLTEEGLTPKRLSVTAKRLARARHALDELADMALQDIMVDNETGRIVLNYQILRAWPGEIGFRVMLKAMAKLRANDDFGPRMEKAEALFEELMIKPNFKQKTLGGVMIGRDDKAQTVVLKAEQSA